MKLVTLKVDEDRVRSWKQAATREGRSLSEFIRLASDDRAVVQEEIKKFVQGFAYEGPPVVNAGTGEIAPIPVKIKKRKAKPHEGKCACKACLRWTRGGSI